MGLDGVELVMAVEEAFDVCIEDAEAENIRTPRELIELVMAKVASANPSVCLSQRAFNLVRKSLCKHPPLTRRDVTPATELSLLLPAPVRRGVLHSLAADLGTALPAQLKRPNWLTAILFGVSILVGLLAAIAFPFTSIGSLLVFPSIAVLTGCVAFLTTKPFQTEFPKSVSNVAALSRWVVAHKPDLAASPQVAWTREQVAARVREIVIDTLGCEKKYSEDARFIEDLGLS
jgi:acyl carrier protein